MFAGEATHLKVTVEAEQSISFTVRY